MSERRVYVRRRGRMTVAQARALDLLAARYCVVPDELGDPAALFGRSAPLAVEVGFGMGQALATMARERPSWNWLGIDVYRPGIGALLNACEEAGLDNVKVAEGDARELVRRLPDGSVELVCVYFPDPWPKKRHQKRRLVDAEFVASLASRLRSGGTVRLATDWRPYAEAMLETLSEAEELFNRHPEDGFAPRNAERPMTRFESRGRALGHEVWDLEFERH